MQTRKLALACPVCHSGEVFYSCTPNCCFNHVCSECGTTFEPVTTLAGGTASGIVPPNPLPEAADPTVACAKCDSTDVYMLDGESLVNAKLVNAKLVNSERVYARLVCAKCGSLLKLEITEVAPG